MASEDEVETFFLNGTENDKGLGQYTPPASFAQSVRILKGSGCCDDSSSMAGKHQYNSMSDSDEAKSPLMALEHQETRIPDLVHENPPWVETSRASTPGETRPPSVSFSLQSYLDDENDLEKRLVGAAELSPGFQAHHMVKQEVRAQGSNHKAATAASAALPGLETTNVDDGGLSQLPAMSAAEEDGTDALTHEGMSLGSHSPRSTTTRASASTLSSKGSSNDQALAPGSVSSRHVAIHRQLEEAGLSGLGDGSHSFNLYHRYESFDLADVLFFYFPSFIFFLKSLADDAAATRAGTLDTKRWRVHKKKRMVRRGMREEGQQKK
ncbi:uncharacterized protein UV8b_01662 [Ustilaginoidea virens]|uniref:Uncharacterized protein n=1 Tax=Ustilaginoidea virens TaxID=1159556 RepID=A0A8E5MFF1_USTVR|nr:uncharacterized protein UV8b_01662 [Ustilaginoidea virens]QUC17421.1 hypothetical protein UV8b_01662 [Ustilaginoidea virens]